MTVINPFDFFLEPYAEHFPFRLRRGRTIELAPFLATIAGGPGSGEYLSIDQSRERAHHRFSGRI